MKPVAFFIRTVALALIVSGLTTTVVTAAVPSPGTSTCPPTVTVTGDASCCFDVVVRDVAGNPVANSTVNVDFGTCRVSLCPVQPPGITIQGNGVIALTDAAGVAHFCICGTIRGQCDAAIRADGISLCTVPVKKKCS